MPQTNSSKEISAATTGDQRAEFAFDIYAGYCETFTAVYGPKYCPTREQWDAMCRKPRRFRPLTDHEFDDNQHSIEDGGPEIYS